MWRWSLFSVCRLLGVGPLPAHVNCCPSLGRNSNRDPSRAPLGTNPPLPLALPAQGAAEPLATGSLEMEFLIGLAQPALGAFQGPAASPCCGLRARATAPRPPRLLEQVQAPARPSRLEKASGAACPAARRRGERWAWPGGSALQGPGLPRVFVPSHRPGCFHISRVGWLSSPSASLFLGQGSLPGVFSQFLAPWPFGLAAACRARGKDTGCSFTPAFCAGPASRPQLLGGWDSRS